MIKPEAYYKYIEPIKDEDFRQEAYLLLFKLIEKADPNKDFERYFIKSLAGFKKDYYKKQKERDSMTVSMDKENPKDLDGGTYADGIAEPADLQSQIEDRDKLANMQRGMTAKEYAVLELFHGAGLTAKEIYDQYPDLNLRNVKQVYNITLKYKNYEK